MFELSVFFRDQLIGRSTFTQEEVRIGRNSDNEVQIDNLGLSRYHASIETVNGIHILKDFGSQNGTYINGEKVTGRRGLNDGDRIALGKFALLFRTDKAQKETAKVRDEASFAVAGATIITTAPTVAERPCPWVGYIETVVANKLERPQIHPLKQDVFVIGAGEGSDLRLEKGSPERAAAVIRGWKGFQLITLAPGVTLRNGEPLELRCGLANDDELSFGGRSYRFRVGRPEAGP